MRGGVLISRPVTVRIVRLWCRPALFSAVQVYSPASEYCTLEICSAPSSTTVTSQTELTCSYSLTECEGSPVHIHISPSTCTVSVRPMGDRVSALLQLYVMGRIPTALQGRTTDAPMLLTLLVEVTIMGLTGEKEKWHQKGQKSIDPSISYTFAGGLGWYLFLGIIMPMSIIGWETDYTLDRLIEIQYITNIK